jgi:phosphoribosylamine--glycine ligase
LEKEQIDYKGFVFIGLMNKNGEPFVIEYNVRMGDPETEAVLPRIESDFVGLLKGIATGTLDQYELKISPNYSTTVVMVSGGYPGSYEKGFPISLPDATEGSVIFHAGTVRNQAGELVNQGGRVLAITGFGSGLSEALDNAFATVNQITWEKAYFRRDIGQDILKLM